jgi:two-component system, LytTR family, sensor histidine kinase AlgZ
MAYSSSSGILLPAFCKGPVILRALVFAQAVAIVLAFAPGAAEDPWLHLGFISLFVQWIMLTTSAALCLLRKPINRLPALRQGFSVMAILLLVTALVSLVAHLLLAQSVWLVPLSAEQFLLQNLLLALIIGLMAIQFFMLHIERQQRIIAQSRAELVALQARIQPHFLFNSLNTVAELTQQDPVAAEQALLDLSSLFRAALYAGDDSTLMQEIQLARQYLALEKWRLGERLQIDWLLPEPIPELILPSLIIQPLLENAVRHGIEPLTEGGRISVQLQVHRHSCTLLIINPAATAYKSKGHGIALDNIRQRLALRFDDAARISSAVVDHQFRLKLQLPLKDKKA